MSTTKTAQGIEVRKVPFEFPSDFQAHWNPDNPALSQLINDTSVMLPYMEPFIIDAIRQASKYITDLDLQKEAKAWIGQESQHFMQHRVADPAWMREWVALYDKGERGLAKLDTSKLQESPVGMLPA